MQALPILLPALLTAFAILGIQAAFGEGMIFGFIPAWVRKRHGNKLQRLKSYAEDAEKKHLENVHDEAMEIIYRDAANKAAAFDFAHWGSDGDQLNFIPPWWTKPLWGCNICMSSVYGLAGFAVFQPAPWVYVLAFIPIVAGIMVAYNELSE